MLDGRYFDAMDAVARAARRNDRPFGGVQLILSGDFYQLPPVNKGEAPEATVFCFQARAWSAAIQHTVLLTKVHRQSDPAFVRLLAEVRKGECSDETAAFLTASASNVVGGNGIQPTLLHSHNEAVGTRTTPASRLGRARRR